MTEFLASTKVRIRDARCRFSPTALRRQKSPPQPMVVAMRGSPVPYRPPASPSYDSPSPGLRRPPAPAYDRPALIPEDAAEQHENTNSRSRSPMPKRPPRRPPPSSSAQRLATTPSSEHAQSVPATMASFVQINMPGSKLNQKRGIKLLAPELAGVPWAVPEAGPGQVHVMFDNLDIVVVDDHVACPANSLTDVHAKPRSGRNFENCQPRDRTYTTHHGGGLTVGTTGSEHLAQARQSARMLSGMQFAPKALQRRSSLNGGRSDRSSASHRSQ